MIDAVIFDMDGLLIDSEGIGVDVMRESGALHGVQLEDSLIRSTLGANIQSSCEKYRSVYPRLDAEAMFETFNRLMRERAQAGLVPLKKGALSLLRFLENHHIPRAIASSSPLDMVHIYLEKNDVAHFFPVLTTGSDNLPSKPNPHIFLKAAERLGADPAHCLILEDSVNGVKAGRAAGMQVCMVPDLTPFSPSLQPYCDHVLDDLGQVIGLLQG